ncbi:MAG TPA: hypothetical protein VD737_01550 [Steroidobacteraceae bacterium]|nr:hypothetical protein [Steroidobacteraceae bacterium]
MAWLALGLPAVGRAQGVNALERLHLPDLSTLLVLGAGFGVVLIAAGVLVFAIRQLRREAAERRRLYNRHRRGSHAHRPHVGPPRSPMTDR